MSELWPGHGSNKSANSLNYWISMVSRTKLNCVSRSPFQYLHPCNNYMCIYNLLKNGSYQIIRINSRVKDFRKSKEPGEEVRNKPSSAIPVPRLIWFCGVELRCFVVIIIIIISSSPTAFLFYLRVSPIQNVWLWEGVSEKAFPQLRTWSNWIL